MYVMCVCVCMYSVCGVCACTVCVCLFSCVGKHMWKPECLPQEFFTLFTEEALLLNSEITESARKLESLAQESCPCLLSSAFMWMPRLWILVLVQQVFYSLSRIPSIQGLCFPDELTIIRMDRVITTYLYTYTKPLNYLGNVAHSGSWGKMMIWAYESESSLGNTERLCLEQNQT